MKSRKTTTRHWHLRQTKESGKVPVKQHLMNFWATTKLTQKQKDKIFHLKSKKSPGGFTSYTFDKPPRGWKQKLLYHYGIFKHPLDEVIPMGTAYTNKKTKQRILLLKQGNKNIVSLKSISIGVKGKGIDIPLKKRILDDRTQAQSLAFAAMGDRRFLKDKNKNKIPDVVE